MGKQINRNLVCPCVDDIFNCFDRDLLDYKLVVVGQDPYPLRIANGYAFDTKYGTRPALEIIKKAGIDYGINIDSLSKSQDQVLWLNANLSTKIGLTKQHDWRPFTQQVIELIKENNPKCGFAFLGEYAQTINVVNGLNFYHPTANFYSGKELFNSTFFEQTSQYIDWKTIY